MTGAVKVEEDGEMTEEDIVYYSIENGEEGERRGEIGIGERASENEKGGENERKTEW